MPTLESPATRSIQIEHPFLVLPENRFAYCAAFGIAEVGASPGGMIVTVFGPTGTGKTHLIREAVRNCSRARSAARIARTTGQELAELITAAIEQRTVEQFRENHATVDVLLCDDFDKLPQNRTIQEQTCALLDALTCNGGSALLAAQKPLGELRHLSRRIVNRCHEGIAAEVRMPGAASRRNLLQHFAAALRLPVPADVQDEIVRIPDLSGRELLSLVKRLHAFAHATQRAISVELLEELLEEEPARARIPLNSIAVAVAAEFGVSLNEMQSDSRARRSLVSRQTAMMLAREISAAPLSEIGAFFGGRNHSTVVHACHRARQLIAVDREVASVVAQIRQLLSAKRERPRRKPGDQMSAGNVRAG